MQNAENSGGAAVVLSLPSGGNDHFVIALDSILLWTPETKRRVNDVDRIGETRKAPAPE